MNINKLAFNSPLYPAVLRRIPGPPKQLFHSGAPLENLLKRPRIAIIGSRNVSAYGKWATLKLAAQLAEQGIVIISGLAIGVDALAHRAALDAGGLTLAVLPSPLEMIVPASNRFLAQEILDNGGVLVSEYAAGDGPYKQNFIARNRLMSGLADAILITEAAEKSGTLHTANFALQQNKDVLVVPGNINSTGYVGANNLIKSGARMVTSYLDVLHELGLEDHATTAKEVRGRNQYEQTVLDLMLEGINDGDHLLERSKLSPSEFNQVLTMLEIGGKIRSLGANHWGVY